MKILIIGNCITKECLRIRKNSNYSSAAAQKKLLLMSRTFEKTGHIVDISSASYSKHIHSLFIEKISPDIRIIHSPTIGFFGKFSFFKKTIHVLFCILWILLHPRHYDAVIFYNFHIDFSLPAICADLLSHVKLIKKFRLIMDYEDGLFLDRGYTGIFNRFWEKIVYKRVFHYILVNDGLKERIETIAPSPLNKYITVNGFIDENLLSESKSKHTSSLQQLLFTGNFSKGFGFEQLVDYIENIDENLTLTITGRAGQEETKKIEALSHRKKNVFFHGFLDEVNFSKIVDSADAMILLNDENSSFNHTNFPSKFFDYLSRNQLIITSKNSILSKYYHLNNLIVIKDFPSDIKKIKKLNESKRRNYEQIRSIAVSTQNLMNNFLTKELRTNE